MPLCFIHTLTIFHLYRSASKAPGISNPYITGPYSLDELPNSFLIVMSGGLCKSLMKAQGSNGYDANEVLSRMVAEELCASGSLKDVSGKILGNLLQHMEGLFREDEAFKKSCSEVHDMTLLIRNLGFPLGDPAAKPCAYVMQARPKNDQVRKYPLFTTHTLAPFYEGHFRTLLYVYTMEISSILTSFNTLQYYIRTKNALLL